MRRLARFATGALLALPLLWLLAPSAVRGQQVSNAVAPLPSGSATIQGVVELSGGEPVGPGVPVVAYALDAQGRPGVGNTETDDAGRFRFENVAGDPETIYLVGARYQEVPFGRRVAFESGSTTTDVSITVLPIRADVSRARIEESLYRVDALGATLRVEVTQRLQNDSDAVIFVPTDRRADSAPLFRATLPEDAHDAGPAAAMDPASLEITDGEARFWGPLYPGDQEIGYRYALPVAGNEARLMEALPAGSPRVVAVGPEGGPRLRPTRAATEDEIEIEGVRYQRLAFPALAPGAPVDLAIDVPESRNDPGALSLVRATVWLELDDTSLTATTELTTNVQGATPLAAPPGSPLLDVALPPGAELLGLSTAAQAAGGQPSESGVAFSGPLPPGESEIALRYRMPPDRPGAGVELALRFPKPVPVLSLLVADTGVEIESARLHRLRPLRAGTRIYLRREAFAVAPDETLRVRVSPRVRPTLPRSATIGFALVALAAASWFLFAPLRPEAGADRATATPETRERDAVYANIADLDHDFETGKLEEADYRDMRAELRTRAVELMRQERAAAVGAEAPVAAAHPASCPACGVRAEAGWSFCAACGAALPGDSGADGARTA